jgi:uncharacterized protein (TIRG00374 family)
VSTGKAILLAALLVALVAAVGLYTDLAELRGQLVDFDWLVLLPALGLALANYLIRFVKWQVFLKQAGAPTPFGVSLRVFFSGLSMTVTPGKVGEVLKPFLLQKATGTPVATTVPVVVAERLTDLLAGLLLALFGVLTSGYGLDIFLAGAALCALVLIVSLWGKAGELFLTLFSRLAAVRKRREALLELQRSMLRLVGLGPIVIATAFSVAAWFAECVAFYLVVQAAGQELSLANAVFIYSLGSIAGAVTMLPGGLVATEASMVFVLVEVFRGCTRPAAVASVLVVRLCTLWFAVLLGLVALWDLRRVKSLAP